MTHLRRGDLSMAHAAVGILDPRPFKLCLLPRPQELERLEGRELRLQLNHDGGDDAPPGHGRILPNAGAEVCEILLVVGGGICEDMSPSTSLAAVAPELIARNRAPSPAEELSRSRQLTVA